MSRVTCSHIDRSRPLVGTRSYMAPKLLESGVQSLKVTYMRLLQQLLSAWKDSQLKRIRQLYDTGIFRSLFTSHFPVASMPASTAGGSSNGTSDPSQLSAHCRTSSTSQLVRGFNPKYFPWLDMQTILRDQKSMILSNSNMCSF